MQKGATACLPLLTKLTDRQAKIFEFIKDRVQSRGYGPTVR